MARRGVNVAMGLDDKTINDDEDAVMELRMLHKLHRVPSYDLTTPPLAAREVLAMGTLNGARALGFAGRLGALTPGLKADAILVDLDRVLDDPWLTGDLDIVEAFVHRAMGADVATAVVGGRVVMEDRTFLTGGRAYPVSGDPRRRQDHRRRAAPPGRDAAAAEALLPALVPGLAGRRHTAVLRAQQPRLRVTPEGDRPRACAAHAGASPDLPRCIRSKILPRVP